MDEFLTDLVGQDTWLRVNAAVSLALFLLLIYWSDKVFIWRRHRGATCQAIIALGRLSLFLVLVGCVGNVADWWIGMPHRPSEILVNAGLLMFMVARIAEQQARVRGVLR